MSDYLRDVPLDCGGTVSGRPEHVATVLNIDRKFTTQTQAWIAELRAAGVKAAHPDDGWVHRKPNGSGKIHLEYPNFNDGLGVGDLLALGWPWRETRLVRVTEVEHTGGLIPMTYYSFVQVDPDPHDAWLEAQPRPPFLLRLFGAGRV